MDEGGPKTPPTVPKAGERNPTATFEDMQKAEKQLDARKDAERKASTADKLSLEEADKVKALKTKIEAKEQKTPPPGKDTAAAYAMFKDKYKTYETLSDKKDDLAKNREKLVIYLREILMKSSTDANADKALVAAYKKEDAAQKTETEKVAKAQKEEETKILANVLDFQTRYVSAMVKYARSNIPHNGKLNQNNLVFLTHDLGMMSIDAENLQKFKKGTPKEQKENKEFIDRIETTLKEHDTAYWINKCRDLNKALILTGIKPYKAFTPIAEETAMLAEAAKTGREAGASLPKAGPNPLTNSAPGPKAAPAAKAVAVPPAPAKAAPAVAPAPKAPPVAPGTLPVANAAQPAPSKEKGDKSKPAPAKPAAKPAVPAATPPAAPAPRAVAKAPPSKPAAKPPAIPKAATEIRNANEVKGKNITQAEVDSIKLQYNKWQEAKAAAEAAAAAAAAAANKGRRPEASSTAPANNEVKADYEPDVTWQRYDNFNTLRARLLDGAATPSDSLARKINALPGSVTRTEQMRGANLQIPGAESGTSINWRIMIRYMPRGSGVSEGTRFYVVPAPSTPKDGRAFVAADTGPLGSGADSAEDIANAKWLAEREEAARKAKK